MSRYTAVYHGGIYVLLFAFVAPLLHLAIGLSLDRIVDPFTWPAPYHLRPFGTLLFLSGVVWIVTGTVWLYRVGRGLPLSSSPARDLVTCGPYRWSRHPIYLGATLAFMGAAGIYGSFWGTVLAGPLLGVFYFSYACGLEEPALLARFGEAYHDYQACTALFLVFPLHGSIRDAVACLLERLSRTINRPRMLRCREHILFWGYGIWPGMGVALGLAVMEAALIEQGVPVQQTAWIVAVATLAGLMGTRMLWRATAAVHDRVRFGCTAGRVGFVSWGALGGLLLMAPAFFWITGRSVYLFFDTAFPGLMVAHVFGRIGCTFYGCCYGKEAVTAIRLQYWHPALKVVRERQGQPAALLPVQLGSAIYGGLTAALVLGLWYRQPLPRGLPAALSATLYGCCRLSEEWLRAQHGRLRAGLSTAQMVACVLVAVGLLHLGLNLPGSSQAGDVAVEVAGIRAVFAHLHLCLLSGAGLLTAFVFSYHYRTVGQWR